MTGVWLNKVSLFVRNRSRMLDLVYVTIRSHVQRFQCQQLFHFTFVYKGTTLAKLCARE